MKRRGREGGRRRRKTNLGHPLLSPSASRVPCSPASRTQHTPHYARRRVTGCARANGGRLSQERARRTERPSANQASVPESVYTKGTWPGYVCM